MTPDESPSIQGWRLPAFSWQGGAVLLSGLLIAAYVGGCMVSYQQERDLQWMREQACKQDPHCLHP